MRSERRLKAKQNMSIGNVPLGSAYEWALRVGTHVLTNDAVSVRISKNIFLNTQRTGTRQHHKLALFMTTSRIGKKSRGRSGFVKKSARVSTLRRNYTVICRSSTFFLTKRRRLPVCLVREWCSGLYARSMAALLSKCSSVEQRAQVDRLLGRFQSRDDFGLATRRRYRSLLL
eukprot:6175295-Pleurochrysis_carterae.AAC.1